MTDLWSTLMADLSEWGGLAAVPPASEVPTRDVGEGALHRGPAPTERDTPSPAPSHGHTSTRLATVSTITRSVSGRYLLVPDEVAYGGLRVGTWLIHGRGHVPGAWWYSPDDIKVDNLGLVILGGVSLVSKRVHDALRIETRVFSHVAPGHDVRGTAKTASVVVRAAEMIGIPFARSWDDAEDPGQPRWGDWRLGVSEDGRIFSARLGRHVESQSAPLLVA